MEPKEYIKSREAPDFQVLIVIIFQHTALRSWSTASLSARLIRSLCTVQTQILAKPEMLWSSCFIYVPEHDRILSPEEGRDFMWILRLTEDGYVQS